HQVHLKKHTARTARQCDPSGPSRADCSVGNSLRITYCFGGAAGASAGGGAAVPSAGAAAGASAAGAAGASAAGAAGAGSVEAGGEAAGSVLADSCFAQAVSISAATSALRASLVFINRYPKEKQEWCKKDTNEFGRSASPNTDRSRKFYRLPRRFETAGGV